MKEKKRKEKRHAKHCGERDAKSAVHKGSGQGRVHQAKRGLDHAGRQPPLIPGGATMHQTDSKPPRCLVARLPQVEGWQRTATVVVLDGLSDCLPGRQNWRRLSAITADCRDQRVGPD